MVGLIVIICIIICLVIVFALVNVASYNDFSKKDDNNDNEN